MAAASSATKRTFDDDDDDNGEAESGVAKRAASTTFKVSHGLNHSAHGYSIDELLSFLFKLERQSDARLSNTCALIKDVGAELDVSGRGHQVWKTAFTFALEDVGLCALPILPRLLDLYASWCSVVGRSTSSSFRVPVARRHLCEALLLIAAQPKSRLLSFEGQYGTCQAQLELCPLASVPALGQDDPVCTEFADKRSAALKAPDKQLVNAVLRRLVHALRSSDRTAAVRLTAYMVAVLETERDLSVNAKQAPELGCLAMRRAHGVSALVYSAVIAVRPALKDLVLRFAQVRFLESKPLCSSLHAALGAVLLCFHFGDAPATGAAVPAECQVECPSVLYITDVAHTAASFAQARRFTVPAYALDKHTRRGKGSRVAHLLQTWAESIDLDISSWNAAERDKSHGPAQSDRGQSDFYENSLRVGHASLLRSEHEEHVKSELLALERAHGVRACKQKMRVKRFAAGWDTQILQ